MDGPDAYIYDGLVPVTQFSFPTGGLGYYHPRDAIGIHDTPETLAMNLDRILPGMMHLAATRRTRIPIIPTQKPVWVSLAWKYLPTVNCP